MSPYRAEYEIKYWFDHNTSTSRDEINSYIIQCLYDCDWAVRKAISTVIHRDLPQYICMLNSLSFRL